MSVDFTVWLYDKLGCEWENYEGNLNDDDLASAWNAGYVAALDDVKRSKELCP